MHPCHLHRARHRKHLAPCRERRVQDLLELLVRQISAHHHDLGARSSEQRGEVLDVPQRPGGHREATGYEPDGPILGTGTERRALDRGDTLDARSHEEGVQPVTLGRPHPPREVVQCQSLRHQPRPHQHRHQRVLRQHQVEPARRDRHPQGERGGERAPEEQAPRAAPPVARAVVTGHQESHEQRRGVLPAGQDAGRQNLPCALRSPCAEHRVVSHRAHQLAHPVERREIGDDERDEAAQGTQQMAANVRGGAPLQAEPDADGRVALQQRRVDVEVEELRSTEPPLVNRGGCEGRRHASRASQAVCAGTGAGAVVANGQWRRGLGQCPAAVARRCHIALQRRVWGGRDGEGPGVERTCGTEKWCVVLVAQGPSLFSRWSGSCPTFTQTQGAEEFMVRAVKGSWVAAVFATLGLATACTDPQSPRPQADLLPTGGVLTVAVTTTGSDIDPDGYTVWVDNSQSQAVAANGLVTFTGLAEGAHEVSVLGVAANCTVQVNNPRAVTVTAGVAGATQVDVGCASKGSLFVATNTTGVDLDADGYTVTVDGAVSQPMATNGNVTFTGLATGSHAVAFSGVAGNCTLSGANPQTGTVSAGGTASLAFSLSCAPTGSGTGSLTVTTSTTGSNLDPDGYTLTLDGTSC